MMLKFYEVLLADVVKIYQLMVSSVRTYEC